MFGRITQGALRGLIAGGLTCLLAVALPVPAEAAIQRGTVYGTGGLGGAPGEVRAPEGIGVDPISGRIVLADYSKSRISIFEPDGGFVLAFGKDVVPGGGTGPEVCTTSCKAGVDGSEAGELNSPYEAEFSPSGKEIFVGEGSNGRVSVFSDEGIFLRAFGADVIPGGGTGPEICTTTTTCKAGAYDGKGGSFAQVWPLTFGPDGLVYVADSSAHRISVHQPNGTWLRTFGKDVDAGGGSVFEVCSVSADCKVGVGDGSAGSLASPQGLDFDPAGRLWVNASNTNQVQIIGTAPLAPVAALGKDVVPGGATGFESCNDPCQAAPPGSGPGELKNPNGLGVSADGTAYAADPGNQRVNAYRGDLSFAFAIGADVVPGGGVGFETCTTICKAGLPNELTGFDYPYAVAVDCRGIVYVSSDIGNFVPARAHGEPGLQPGPCTLSAKVLRRNKRRGSANLAATVPYASDLTLTGKNIRKSSAEHSGLEGAEKLAIKPKGKLAKRLRRKGKAKVRVTVTMKPTDGNVAQTTKTKLKLKQKQKRRRRSAA